MRRTCDADVPISLSSDGRFIANETKKRNAAYGVSLFSFCNNASLTCSFYSFCHPSSGRANRSCAMKKHLQNRFCFVRIIPKKNANFGLALRKRLFCNAKPTLLPCKRAAFGTQNNRFCNALIARWLRSSCACEKYLQFYCLLPSVKRVLSTYEMRSTGEVEWWGELFSMTYRINELQYCCHSCYLF